MKTLYSIYWFTWGLVAVTLTMIANPWAVTMKGDNEDGQNKEG